MTEKKQMVLAFYQWRNLATDPDPVALGYLINYALKERVWDKTSEAARDLDVPLDTVEASLKAHKADIRRVRKSVPKVPTADYRLACARGGLPEAVLKCFTKESEIGEIQIAHIRALARRLGWDQIEANASKHPSRGGRRSIARVMRILATGDNR